MEPKVLRFQFSKLATTLKLDTHIWWSLNSQCYRILDWTGLAIGKEVLWDTPICWKNLTFDCLIVLSIHDAWQASHIYIYLYTKTVLDSSVIMSVCPFAIETTFPLSNFKTKHIFGILMTLRKLLKLWAPQVPEPWGAVGSPNFFIILFPPPRAAQNGRPRRRRRCSPGGREKSLNSYNFDWQLFLPF